MPNLDAPARLAFWPEFPWDQGRDYGTLRQALTEAAQRPSEPAWIVTLSGRILKPREISELIGTVQGGGRGRLGRSPLCAWRRRRLAKAA